MSKYGAFSGPYFPAFGLNRERHFVSLCIQSECGKIRAKKNSVFWHISHSVKREKHWHLHMTDLFSWRKYISNCTWIKQSHLGKCRNKKLHTWTLVNNGTLRNTADFASALGNVKKMLKYQICFPTGLDASQMDFLNVLYSVSETSQRGLIWKSLRRLPGDWLKAPSQRRIWDFSGFLRDVFELHLRL